MGKNINRGVMQLILISSYLSVKRRSGNSISTNAVHADFLRLLGRANAWRSCLIMNYIFLVSS